MTHPDDSVAKAPMSSADALLPLTQEDFATAGLTELLAAHSEADIHELYNLLIKALEVSEGAAARSLMLLAGVCSMMLVPEQPSAIYRPRTTWGDGTGTMGPDHLSVAVIDVLAQVVDTVDRPLALRARMADLVWLRARRRDPRFARIAIEAYTSRDITLDAWQRGGSAEWHRALQLAREIKGREELEKVERKLLEAFFSSADSAEDNPLQYLKPLAAEKRAKARAGDIAGQLEMIGRRHFAAAHAFPAESYFQAAAHWYKRAGQAEHWANMLAMVADAIALQAQQGAGAMIEHTWLTKAISAYREVPGHARERLGVDKAIEALRRRRELAGHAVLGEMVTVRSPRIDVSDLAKMSVEYVSGRNSVEALVAFCALDGVPDGDVMMADAEKSLQQDTFSALFSGAVISSDGRQVANTGPEDGWEQQIAAKARENFRQHASLVAVSSLAPTLNQLRSEHGYRRDDFNAIAERSPIVPADRARIVGQGLYAGFCGDMIQALHVLMPQFEHIVRHVLKGSGAFTAQHDRDGLDSEVGLSKLIERPQMIEEFGEGLTLAIHAIMCDRAGSNLRNDVAHGLADEALCESPLTLYGWWMVLKLVTETCVGALRAENSASEHHQFETPTDEGAA